MNTPTHPTRSTDETAYYEARTREGLAQAERGEGIDETKARHRMERYLLSVRRER